ncbi:MULTISPECIES: CheF family chemotaxis protein [Halobellus]|uniref:CheF family chemotaxis protein n=1 Tax=Halobellus TaxID=1073986 RepID=UPI00211531B5|nr:MULTISPECIES: CheF family chemotaxis protein [Halobellus]MDQ2053594.1 CheF family chemotaxis protein [Halobellus sp. H-GB7]
MKPGETKLADTRGRFLQALRNGRERSDAGWTNGRILLSNKRIVLAGTSGKRTFPLSKIEQVGGRFDVNQRVATVADYIALQFDDGEDVILVAPAEFEEFEMDLYDALLSSTKFLVRHPAVEGGVVQNTEWERAKMQVETEAVNIATVAGTFVGVQLDDIGDIEMGRRTVREERREVIEVEHSDDNGTSVQTYISGPERAVGILKSLLRIGEEQTETALDLSRQDKQVLMALYSGVSPFDIPAFLGIDVDEVEELFVRLIDHDVLDEVRIRHEVELNARGRSIAADAIDEQGAEM